MYEAMEICSRTLQFFSCLFVLHVRLRNSIPHFGSWRSAPWRPSDFRLGHVCGCCNTAVRSPRGKNYSIPWWRLCGREWKHQKKKKTWQTQTGWLSRLCGRWSQHKLKDKTRSALRNSTPQQEEDVLRGTFRGCCCRSDAVYYCLL